MKSRIRSQRDENDVLREEKRIQNLEESKSTSALKHRYGLFSYTGSLAIGENSSELARRKRRIDSDGNVPVGPRNFYTSPTRKDAYFSKPEFVSVGSTYQSPVTEIKRDLRISKSSPKIHDTMFHVGPSKKTEFSPYPYMPFAVEKKFDRRIGPGEVRIGEKNFLTKSPPRGSLA